MNRMTSTHRGTSIKLTLGDVFHRHRQVIRELLERNHGQTTGRTYPAGNADSLVSHHPCRRPTLAQEISPCASYKDFLFHPVEDRTVDSFPITGSERGDELFDCLSVLEDILQSPTWDDGRIESVEGLVVDGNDATTEYDAWVLEKIGSNEIEHCDNFGPSKDARNYSEIEDRQGREHSSKIHERAESRIQKKVEETPSAPLSPPQPIRETCVGLSDEFNASIDMWTDLNCPLSSSERYPHDEDPRPGLSPLTVFSDDQTDFWPHEHVREQHFSTAHGFVVKPSPMRMNAQHDHSPHLIPSPRSFSSAHSVITFNEPVLRTTVRAKSRNSYFLQDTPSSPHRIPSTASPSSMSEAAKRLPGSLSPVLSPPRIKSRVHGKKTKN